MKPVYIPEQTPGVAELHMENDLLTHENRILRARLEGSSEAVTSTESSAAEGRKQRSPDDERFRRAYYDLRWLVRRLDSPPLGLVLRRWGGFRVLVDRYGRSAE